jgi:hypothetical protein
VNRINFSRSRIAVLVVDYVGRASGPSKTFRIVSGASPRGCNHRQRENDHCSIGESPDFAA